MSVLAPLFLLGGLAIALPVIFHLIRRQPRGRLAFSSLMFLEASPPRLNRRSRVDDWWLLLLRGLALLLVAAAFTRPFWRSSANASSESVGRISVILIDRSASMQRGDLWEQAIEAAVAEVESLRPTDQVAWVAFDTEVEILRDFVSTANAEGKASDPETVRATLSGIHPTWRAGDLGAALATAADLIDDAVRHLEVPEVERTIVLISDLQAGSSLADLHGYEWPESTRVRIARIAGDASSNATIAGAERAVVADEAPASNGTGADNGTGDGFRISVNNASDSTAGQFSARWIDASGKPLGTTVSLTVPPGTRRVSRLGAPPAGAVAVELAGDDHPFDNRRYVSVPKATEQTVLFVGNDVEDPRESLLYYLQRVDLDRPGHAVSVERKGASEPLDSATFPRELNPQRVPLVVLAAAPATPLLANLQRYLDAGGRIVMVVDSAAATNGAPEGESGTGGAIAEAARRLSGDPSLRITAAEVEDYALLAQIDFANALFAPLADPRYSDFAKIQFWAHQRITVDDPAAWQTLARFDDGDAALLERRVGSGKLWILAAGWQPTESQLALSSKFVPIIAGMARDIQREEVSGTAVVGEEWALPPSESAEIVAPTGERIAYRSPADARAIDTPGIYQYRDGETTQPVAVNIAVGEGQTEPLDRSVLEQLGVQFTDQERADRQARAERQLKDVELEKQQQWWRVLLLSGLAMIGLETVLSSRARSVRRPSAAEVVP